MRQPATSYGNDNRSSETPRTKAVSTIFAITRRQLHCYGRNENRAAVIFGLAWAFYIN